ncbi:MAG: DeoR/GlpR family DNA-binding transcription regulator [Atribacterota bacterium]|nr:DeoR/GlpR family DNA-binding transcription regulator [Atribacterota bacterium]
MKDRRQKEILDYILAEEFTEVKKIAVKFQVSEMTVRRDLANLGKSGLIKCVFGGGVERTGDQSEPSYKLRMYDNSKEKERIALLADKLIRDTDLIFLDIGSTCLYLAKKIFNRDITVVTNWLPNMIELSKGNKCKIINTGGEIDKKELDSIGILAYEGISNYNFTKAFIGVGGIDSEGISDFRIEITELKKKVIKCAKEVIILADHSKFIKTAPIHIASFKNSSIGKIITSDFTQINPQLVKQINDLGIEIIS